MDRLALKINDFGKAAHQLEYTLERLTHLREQCGENHHDTIAYRDSAIKRFEICYELFWKTLKEYLSKEHFVEVASPKKVFQECFKQKLLSEKEERSLAHIADDRNMLAHVYDEANAKLISMHLSNSLEIMQNIVLKIKSQ